MSHTFHMDDLSTEMPPPPPLAWSVETLAARSALGRSFLYQEIKAGRLRARRAGTRLVVLAADAESWLASLPSASSCAIFMKGSRQ